MSAARVIHPDRSAKLVRRYPAKAAWARSRRSSISVSDKASNVLTVSPVAGLIVAIAMSVLLAWGRRSSRRRASTCSFFSVGPAVQPAELGPSPGGGRESVGSVVEAQRLVRTPRRIRVPARGLRAAEAVEALAVPGQDQVAFRGWDARERGLDGAPGRGPIGADVWVVVRPQHPFDTDMVTVLDAERVGHEP